MKVRSLARCTVLALILTFTIAISVSAAQAPAGADSAPQVGETDRGRQSGHGDLFALESPTGATLHSQLWTPAADQDRAATTALAGAAMLPANDCADPYWEHSLRCQVFPGQQPQPNFGDTPASAAEIRPFTRVFLTGDPTVRSLDGTIPVIYVDKAICTEPAGCGGVPYGEPVESNHWIISMTGGGSCYATDSLGSGVIDDAQHCLETYADPGERGEMGTAGEPPMKSLAGIKLPDAALNPVFAGYNRVRVEKSSYDRYNGRVRYVAPGGYFHHTVPGGAIDFDMYQQGYPILEEALRALWSGLNYATWVDNGSGGLTEVAESLPALANADLVLFVGHSGAAHGLHHNIDHLAATLTGLGIAPGSVRAVLDANFVPSIENEALFATDTNGAPLAGDAYTNYWAGETTGSGQPFCYDGAAFHATGRLTEQHESWDAQLDASCEATHTYTDGATWKCRDRGHVLFNHISTPFFLREDFSDPNPEHTDRGQGHTPLWGDRGNYPHCGGAMPCLPIFSVAEFQERVMQQANTLIEDASTRSELATGADTSLGGAGSFPTFFTWLPNCGSHAGVYSTPEFFSSTISYLSTNYAMREWLEQFVAAPDLGIANWRIHPDVLLPFTAAHWGAAAPPVVVDHDGDGRVTVVDILLIAATFGQGC